MISDRERRNDAVYAEHKAAVAAGEKRVLRNTSTGELHSYPADEIGFTPGSGQAQVSTWWGMGILAVVAAILTVFSVVLLLAPLGQGQSPMWGALFLTAAAEPSPSMQSRCRAKNTGRRSSVSCGVHRNQTRLAGQTIGSQLSSDLSRQLMLRAV
ncbi:hypothetical protein [Paenarthrobacter nitroguajacolicus]|uniref:hypothetical protein n=1 Tax=Paenarthrobacter nitroguajacolicus TaxID=211146 RepID=UPI001C4CCB13|nr:hypothetical protein [Paenarthrobacter nitroguajacolicus]